MNEWIKNQIEKCLYHLYLVLVNLPYFANLSNCSEFGLIKCENLVLDGGKGKLGAW